MKLLVFVVMYKVYTCILTVGHCMNEVIKYIVEIKPKKQTKPPRKNPKRKTKSWLWESKEWVRNQAKWESAIKFCDKQGMQFKILTEDQFTNPYK